VLFIGARLVDPEAGTETAGDLLVADRRIAAVGTGLAGPADAELVAAHGLVLAPGLVDPCVFRADMAAATAGGVTAAILMPDQSPPLDDPALVERALRLGKPRMWVHPLAAATRGLDGRSLAELALLIQVARDLRLAREAGAALHIACISTAEAVELVHAAKASGQDVTAATTPAAIILNDHALIGWRTFARLSPPLRSEADRLAVRAALADGTIDMLTSRHDPRTAEEKRLPFQDAAPGAAGLSTLLALGLGLVHEGILSLAGLFDRLARAPARRFGLPGGTLAEGAPADLLLLDPGAPWRIEADRLPGLAGNTPFDGLAVQGVVTRLMKGGEWLR
jgi:dihydroorotase-like cyclic amidohydrolase